MPRNDLLLRVDLINVRDLSRPDNAPNPIDPEYQRHFLAEGDSWFTIGAIPSSNLLFELRLAHWTRILTIAYPGDTIIHMGDIAANKDLRKVLAKPNFNYPFHALLLSDGGNDVIDTRNTLVQANPTEVGNSNDWLDEIHPNHDGYRKIADKLPAGIDAVLLG